MRIFPFAALAAISLAINLAGSASAVAQTATTQHKKIVGYQDETGTFHPFAHADPDAVARSIHTGKYMIDFKITIETALPAGSTILCSAGIDFVSEQEVTSPTFSETAISYEESGSGSVAAGAVGSTVTCPVVINYSWSFPATTKTATDIVTNTVSGSYTVIAYKSSTTTITLSTIEGSRTSDSELPISATPLSTGGSATITVPVTL
jgi:hypothetical protein